MLRVVGVQFEYFGNWKSILTLGDYGGLLYIKDGGQDVLGKFQSSIWTWVYVVNKAINMNMINVTIHEADRSIVVDEFKIKLRCQFLGM